MVADLHQRTGPIGTAPSYFGRTASSSPSGTTNDGKGRWLYRDDAPYILMTYSELKFCLAETYWKMGMKPEALTAFKAAVKADLDFSANYIFPGNSRYCNWWRQNFQSHIPRPSLHSMLLVRMLTGSLKQTLPFRTL